MAAKKLLVFSSASRGYSLSGMKFADLQLHTLFSDGTYTPAELVAAAKNAKLDCIALTDHDTVDGVEETQRHCDAAGIEFIAGCELTADITEQGQSREVHILGLFVNPADEELLRALRAYKQARAARVEAMIARLNQLGVPLNREAVLATADARSALGRLHVARALVAQTFVSDADEAFARYLGFGRPAWVAKYRVSITDAVALIHRAGGVAILAHPGIAHVDEHIPKWLEQGLDGIEVWHTKHTPAQSSNYKLLAERLGCLITGGSDCHGYAKGKVLIGNVKLPYEYVERLREAAAKIRARRADGSSDK
jgi:predicted metal-dependent phosphoesterase TrpH